MSSLLDGVRTRARRWSAKAGVSGLGVKEKWEEIKASRGMGVTERVKNVVKGVKQAGLRRTGSLMLAGHRPIRRWAGMSLRKRYVEEGRTVQTSSTGGDKERVYKVSGRDQYLESDTLAIKVKNIQS